MWIVEHCCMLVEYTSHLWSQPLAQYDSATAMPVLTIQHTWIQLRTNSNSAMLNPTMILEGEGTTRWIFGRIILHSILQVLQSSLNCRLFQGWCEMKWQSWNLPGWGLCCTSSATTCDFPATSHRWAVCRPCTPAYNMKMCSVHMIHRVRQADTIRALVWRVKTTVCILLAH